jgi:hypothetical protein
MEASMKLMILMFILTTQTFAFETNTECPMMRESNQRTNEKQIKSKSLNVKDNKPKSSIQ